MSEEAPAQLLEQVLAEPTTLEPRFVLADWYTERDDPRGQFISVQCTLSDRPRPTPAFAETLKDQEELLLKQHEKKWARNVAGWAISWRFSRGFVEHVESLCRNFLDNRVALFQTEPVSRLRLLCQENGVLTELAMCKELGRIERLELIGNVGDEGVVQLMASKYLSGLKRLSISKAKFGLRGAEAIAAADLGALEQLSIGGNPLKDVGVEALMASKKLKLKRLYLSATGLGDDGLESIANAKCAATLVGLGLDRNPSVSDRGVRALLESPHLTKLSKLELSRGAISNETKAQVKARWPGAMPPGYY